MKLQEIKPLEQEAILDEGLIQNVFNFIWNTTGKILDKMPVVGDKREEARVLADYDAYVEKMKPAEINKIVSALLKKIKSKAGTTTKATARYESSLRKSIETVLKSSDSKQYLIRMRNAKARANEFQKFIKRSNDNFNKTKAKKAG